IPMRARLPVLEFLRRLRLLARPDRVAVIGPRPLRLARRKILSMHRHLGVATGEEDHGEGGEEELHGGARKQSAPRASTVHSSVALQSCVRLPPSSHSSGELRYFSAERYCTTSRSSRFVRTSP